MSNSTDTSDPLAGVSSLYGPGALGGWVCTVLSVFINWNFNIDVRETDTLTNDFLAMLALPVVSAGHIFFLVLDRGPVDLREYGYFTPAELAAAGPIVNRNVAAIEAPLLTCVGFMIVIPYLEFMAARKYHRRRLASCLFAGLLVALGQFPIFLCSTRSEDDSEKPTIFFWSGLLTVLCAVPGSAWLVLIGVIWHHCSSRPHGAKHVDPVGQTDGEETVFRFTCRRHWRLNRRYECCKACGVQSQVAHWAALERMLFSGWPVAVLSSWWLVIFLLVIASITASHREFHFLPKSPNSIRELDQAVALLLGMVTIGCTLWDSVRSHRVGRGAEDGARSMIKELEEVRRFHKMEM